MVDHLHNFLHCIVSSVVPVVAVATASGFDKPWYVISPESSFRVVWDLTGMLLILYEVGNHSGGENMHMVNHVWMTIWEFWRKLGEFSLV